ncbi:biotin--[acetyl-CoA-carboxylase] ligase [uncultured Bartonella sp.]|uniref:biotin--[acetyl-CoA-carboxylase] ligase n=1 Tax=uncultured Bartonella sp. TaxID=104108 RepID=UPI0025E191DB|nr:biotin--[acetyl-CoA-carboxylase] ligase [uncultured Bartonella sp.]
MQFSLSQIAKEHQYKVESYESVDSTNRVALAKARDDEDRLWIVSDEQTAGRARRGRQWSSPKGDLYASLLLTRNIAPENAAELGFVAGVSLADAVKDILAHNGVASDVVTLKWPNDMLLKDAKASGILLELQYLTQSLYALVVGIGVNIIHVYKDAPYPTEAVVNMGVKTDSAEVFKLLSKYWAENYDLYLSPNGREIVRKKWLGYAAHLGEELTITGNSRVIKGIFSGLDEKFNCVVTDCHGVETRVSAGDVHFGNVASLNAGR